MQNEYKGYYFEETPEGAVRIYDSTEGWMLRRSVYVADNEYLAKLWVDLIIGEARISAGEPREGKYPPRIGVIPKLPEEAHGDILFFEYIRDLCKYEALSEEDVQRLWEGYKEQQRR